MIHRLFPVLAVVLLGLCRCGDGSDDCEGVLCEACGAAVVLTVVDAETGGFVDEIHVNGEAGDCMESSGESICQMWEANGPGTFSYEVSALGYTSQRVDVEVPPSEGTGCCDCGYIQQTVDVALEPDQG